MDRHSIQAEIEATKRSLTDENPSTTTTVAGVQVSINKNTDAADLARSVFSRQETDDS